MVALKGEKMVRGKEKEEKGEQGEKKGREYGGSPFIPLLLSRIYVPMHKDLRGHTKSSFPTEIL